MNRIKILKTLKIIRIFLQVIFVLAIIYLALFMEIRFFPCAASLPGGILLAVSAFCESRESYGWGSLCSGLGCLLCFFWMFSVCFATLRVIHHDDNHVSVVQALYPWIGQKLAEGESIDTLILASGYITNYGRYEINENVYYLLRQEEDCSVLFGSYGKILEGKNLTFERRDFDHGKIDVCKFIDAVVSPS